jgi:hypothetical protein
MKKLKDLLHGRGLLNFKLIHLSVKDDEINLEETYLIVAL